MVHIGQMKPTVPDRDKVEPSGGAVEAGYDAWKRAKIERGLLESRDRAAMIPVEQVWRDLKLES